MAHSCRANTRRIWQQPQQQQLQEKNIDYDGDGGDMREGRQAHASASSSSSFSSFRPEHGGIYHSIALRAIGEGEELTVDYHGLAYRGENGQGKPRAGAIGFRCTCGEDTYCRKAIFR